MVQVTLEEASSNLAHLLEQVGQGEEFVILNGNAPLARLSPVIPPRQPGSAIGIVTYVADDFDAPLEDFKDYQ
jgi:antitoxin (DNA-binding transcriptional repressor) of toxin-antitoxin stability system